MCLCVCLRRGVVQAHRSDVSGLEGSVQRQKKGKKWLNRSPFVNPETSARCLSVNEGFLGKRLSGEDGWGLNWESLATRNGGLRGENGCFGRRGR